MAKPTVAFLQAQHQANLCQIQALTDQVASLQKELSRKEAVLRTVQQFYARLKKQHLAGAAPSARREAMAEAKRRAMEEGRTVAVQ